jgi:hypothetical protein
MRKLDPAPGAVNRIRIIPIEGIPLSARVSHASDQHYRGAMRSAIIPS